MSATNEPVSGLALEDMEEFFNLTLDMICVAGRDGYFKRLNPSWSRVLGYSIEELLAEPLINFVHPDDREATHALVARSLAERTELVSFKNHFRCRDGSYRTLEWTVGRSIKRIGLYSIARDVTESDREQQRLAHLLRASRVVVYSLSLGPSGFNACTFVSENIAAQLGYQVSDILGSLQDWRLNVHPDDVPYIEERLAALSKEGQQTIKYRFRHKDGGYRWLEDERQLIRDESGAPSEILGAWRDVTDSVRDEELIRSQASALNELSTPLIPISDHVMVMPLIGTMDVERAAQVIETLLKGVSERRARVAIVDITGVSVVDAHVADALLQAARALRLLGAEVVLTGIRPDVALTLVGLGLDLTGIVTKGTLQAGIVHAMHGAELEPDPARRGGEGPRGRAASRLDRA